MPELLDAYAPSILALGLFGALYLVQLLVADVAAVRRKHTPGTPILGDHDDFLFRASRAHANTTESVGATILIAGFAIASGGEPTWVNASMWVFLAGRVVHTLAYWSDVRLLRSAAFVLGIVALLVLFVTGLRAF